MAKGWTDAKYEVVEGPKRIRTGRPSRFEQLLLIAAAAFLFVACVLKPHEPKAPRSADAPVAQTAPDAR